MVFSVSHISIYILVSPRRTKMLSMRLVLDGWECTGFTHVFYFDPECNFTEQQRMVSHLGTKFLVSIKVQFDLGIQDIETSFTASFKPPRSDFTGTFGSIKLNPIKKRLPPSPLMAHPMHTPPTLREKRRSFPINHARHGIPIRMQDDIR